jgi:hypothetical protein
MKRALIVVAAFLALADTSSAEPIISGAQGDVNRPTAIYYANIGLSHLDFSLWSNSRAVATGITEEGAAACSTYPKCAHRRVTITFTYPAVLPCGKDGRQVDTFTHAVVAGGLRVQLDAEGSGLCIWYLVRRFGASG